MLSKGYRVEKLYVQMDSEFHDLLIELPLNMSDDIPPPLREANISPIFQKGKIPEDWASYRPISLLNDDLKLLSKILAKRFENVLPTFVNDDQTGFIKARNSYNNLRR